ncbi:MAG TPA: protein kinase, partial [Polyangiaceae bacterium]|nr:protein kinase [Polyangiaceae bacterium]
THLELGQLVALKFLLPAAELNAEATARFIREARAAVRISSEHVARVTDVGRLENGAPYMVMEYLEGVDLGEHVKGAHLPIESAADFVLQACEAIAVAHALGIVHRDLKPANLFVTIRPDGTPLIKVLDFGISKVVGINEQNPSLTKTSAVMGSPLYMSPEQMRSARNVDARADIWALGTILHELIAGSPPFGGETLGEVFANVMTVEATPLRALRPETPERLERLVQRALEKDPARRTANVGDLAAALVEFAPPRSRALVARVQGVLQRAGLASSSPEVPEAAVELGTSGAVAAGVAATDTSWGDQASRNGRSSKRPLALAAVGVVLLAAVGGTVALRASRAPTPVASEVTATVTLVAPSAPANAIATAQAPVVAPLPEPIVSAEASAAPASSASVANVQRAPASQHAAPAGNAHSAPTPHAAVLPAPTPPAPAPVAAPAAAPAKARNPLNIDFK